LRKAKLEEENIDIEETSDVEANPDIRRCAREKRGGQQLAAGTPRTQQRVRSWWTRSGPHSCAAEGLVG